MPYTFTLTDRPASGNSVPHMQQPPRGPASQHAFSFQQNHKAPPYPVDMDEDMLSPKSTTPPQTTQHLYGYDDVQRPQSRSMTAPKPSHEAKASLSEKAEDEEPTPSMPERSLTDLGGLRPIKIVHTPSSSISSLMKPDDTKHNSVELEKMRLLYVVDQKLKKQIRVLRLIARILAFVVAVLVFVPITITLVTYLRTRNTFRSVTRPDGTVVNRTAWAANSVVWPTYMYFGVAAASLLMNVFIMFSYLRKNISAANTGAYIAGTFSWIVMIGNIVVYAVAVSLYRSEFKSTDLWGWSCSQGAQGIQAVFEDQVDFQQQCNFQSYSWYAGIVQFLTALLTLVVFYMIWKRSQGKKLMAKIEQGNFGDEEMQMNGKKPKKDGKK